MPRKVTSLPDLYWHRIRGALHRVVGCRLRSLRCVVRNSTLAHSRSRLHDRRRQRLNVSGAQPGQPSGEIRLHADIQSLRREQSIGSPVVVTDVRTARPLSGADREGQSPLFTSEIQRHHQRRSRRSSQSALSVSGPSLLESGCCGRA